MRNLREYFRPSIAEEAVDIKLQYGVRSAYLGGGSDLLVHKPPGVEAVIDIRHCGIDSVVAEDGILRIGGGALLRDAERVAGTFTNDMLLRALRDTAPWLIRNAATVSGNIANASPAADSVPALLALDAELVLLGREQREVPLHSIFEGPHRTRLGDELIIEIRISDTALQRSGHFIKLARSASDIALVNLAVSLAVTDGIVRDVRIALGAVAPFPMRAHGAESVLKGNHITDAVLREVQQTVSDEVRPISDWRATEEYRRRMSGVLTRRAIEYLVGRDGADA